MNPLTALLERAVSSGRVLREDASIVNIADLLEDILADLDIIAAGGGSGCHKSDGTSRFAARHWRWSHEQRFPECHLARYAVVVGRYAGERHWIIVVYRCSDQDVIWPIH